jgi:hypothetical protein
MGTERKPKNFTQAKYEEAERYLKTFGIDSPREREREKNKKRIPQGFCHMPVPGLSLHAGRRGHG